MTGAVGDREIDPHRFASSAPDSRFEGLYKEHFELIYAYMIRRVRLADVPDLVADVFATAWRRIEDIPSPPEATLWLYGVAKNVVSQHHRGRIRRERLFAKSRRNLSGATGASHDDVSLAQMQLHELLNRLRTDDQELVRLVVWEELSHSQVAVILNCSPNAVAIRWHRAVERLRRDAASLGDSPLRSAHHTANQTLRRDH
jgi:RNA polymerase sigma-70 factor (ECF subfamily)